MLFPSVLFDNAESPIAKLPVPFVFNSKASLPSAILVIDPPPPRPTVIEFTVISLENVAVVPLINPVNVAPEAEIPAENV